MSEATEQLQELVDHLFVEKKYIDCYEELQKHEDDILESPLDLDGWYHLRHGQVLLEIDRPQESSEALEEAFAIGGFSLFRDEEERYLSHIQAYVDRRLKSYHIACLAAGATLIGTFVAVYIIDHMGIGRGTVASGFVYAGLALCFIIAAVATSSLSPYRDSDSTTSVAEAGEFGPVD